ncbi:MAG: enoyl-CoA hydratase/isomerase family protein [Sneathiellales bacterium]|nr:enoyl-CoA hydratase/isomerase family protein [Sneathiellales bacterium]
MTEQSVVAFEANGPLAILTMNNRPHNLIGPALMSGILEGLETAKEAGSRAVLLKSGLRHFSAGADLTLFESAIEGEKSKSDLTPALFLEKMETFPLPIVAAVHGVCVGGGFELALACDFIIAAKSSKIGSVEATIGVNPLMGAIQRQTQRAGALRAKEMAMLARRYDAETLERWNLINRVVDDEKLEEAAMAVALEIAGGPTLAHTITKEICRIAVNEGVKAADDIMSEKQLPLWSSEDIKTGLESLQTNGPGLAIFKGR